MGTNSKIRMMFNNAKTNIPTITFLLNFKRKYIGNKIGENLTLNAAPIKTPDSKFLFFIRFQKPIIKIVKTKIFNCPIPNVNFVGNEINTKDINNIFNLEKNFSENIFVI